MAINLTEASPQSEIEALLAKIEALSAENQALRREIEELEQEAELAHKTKFRKRGNWDDE